MRFIRYAAVVAMKGRRPAKASTLRCARLGDSNKPKARLGFVSVLEIGP